MNFFKATLVPLLLVDEDDSKMFLRIYSIEVAVPDLRTEFEMTNTQWFTLGPVKNRLIPCYQKQIHRD